MLIDQYNNYIKKLKSSDVKLNIEWQREVIVSSSFYIWIQAIKPDHTFFPKVEYEMVYPFSFELFTYTANHHLTSDFKASLRKGYSEYIVFIYCLYVTYEIRTLFESILPNPTMEIIDDLQSFVEKNDLLDKSPFLVEISKIRKRLYYEFNNGNQLKMLIDRTIYNGFKKSLYLIEEEKNIVN